MKTQVVPENYQHISPAGAEIRFLMDNAYGGMVHCTLPNKKISRAVRHKTVSELWYVLSGCGAIWRRNASTEHITKLMPGVTIDIPLGTDFQYRSDDGDLVFICVTTPPWVSADEAEYIGKGAWEPTPS